MASALRFENVTKLYRPGLAHGSLRDAVAATVMRRRRTPAPQLVALDRLSFEVRHGEAVGLVGRNGAGKTTALKVATRVVRASRGTVRIRGRIGALIEVGTGLHPDLTGRDNVDLFGRIMGLSRSDIRRRFDDIVDFAGLSDAIDWPVRQYSSGMQLRLGFSIAAHLEPDILIVDEAMAVGDAAFQHKCLRRMADLVAEGRTLLFVSHDVVTMEAVCQRALCLVNGKLTHDGPVSQVVADYQAEVNRQLAVEDEQLHAEVGDRLIVTGVSLHDIKGVPITGAHTGEVIAVRLRYRAAGPIPHPHFSIGISRGGQHPLILASTVADGGGPDIVEGDGVIECVFDDVPLNAGVFEIWGSASVLGGVADLVSWRRLYRFTVERPPGDGQQVAVAINALSPVAVRHRWRWSANFGRLE